MYGRDWSADQIEFGHLWLDDAADLLRSASSDMSVDALVARCYAAADAIERRLDADDDMPY